MACLGAVGLGVGSEIASGGCALVWAGLACAGVGWGWVRVGIGWVGVGLRLICQWEFIPVFGFRDALSKFWAALK